MFAVFVAAAVSAAQPVVQVEQGRLAGQALPDGSAIFRGIPFAQPPVGALRWKPPQPPKPWSGLREASRTAAACAQVDHMWNHEAAEGSSEDCLYLELRTPILKSRELLPVMVWIHGGGNSDGSSAGVVTSGITAHGVVLASIQYRLGPFGFMSHPALSRENPRHASGNYGLMDQQAALRWIRNNIAAFGGDPNNITMFGQSAGAHDIGLLLVEPSARGLFQKAIQESGTADFGLPPRTLQQNEELGEAVAVKAGASAHATATDLRRLTTAAILKAESAAIDGLTAQSGTIDGVDPNLLWVQAVVDGSVLVESPSATLKHGGQVHVPLIIGSNTKELLRGLEATPLLRNLAETITTRFGANAGQVLSFYGLSGNTKAEVDPKFGDAATQLWSDVGFHCPANALAEAQATLGAPVWEYLFGYSSGGQPVTHASEIPLVLAPPGAVPASAPQLQAYWINFAKSGDPNGPNLPRWPRFTRDHPEYLDFEADGTRAESGLRNQVCRFANAR